MDKPITRKEFEMEMEKYNIAHWIKVFLVSIAVLLIGLAFVMGSDTKFEEQQKTIQHLQERIDRLEMRPIVINKI